MYLFIEKGLKGGISYIGRRCAKAKLLGDMLKQITNT